MPQVSETIPAALKPRVDAAVGWFNASAEAQGVEFEATGILDVDDALGGSEELRLILCGGDRCEQRSFQVRGARGAWEVDFASEGPLPNGSLSDGEKPQAELDPPPGPRLRWLDEKLGQHAFVVLLFYRGFW